MRTTNRPPAIGRRRSAPGETAGSGGGPTAAEVDGEAAGVEAAAGGGPSSKVTEAQKLSQSVFFPGRAGIMWTALTSQSPGLSKVKLAWPEASERALRI